MMSWHLQEITFLVVLTVSSISINRILQFITSINTPSINRKFVLFEEYEYQSNYYRLRPIYHITSVHEKRFVDRWRQNLRNDYS